MSTQTVSAPTARDQLLSLIATLSFQLGKYKLSSGKESDYYIDCRTSTFHAEGARLVGRVVYDLIKEKRWKPQAIGGMTLGADPIVTAVSILSAQSIVTRSPARTRPLDFPDEFLIHGFVVRKEEKQHGTGKRIEGFCKAGTRVVVVDDVCTTGASTVQAIGAARAAGMDVVGVLCLVEREDGGGRAAVEMAASPAPFVSVFTAAEVRAEHERQKTQPE
ncbi:MAG: orotate phosphoribosyltransferase [Acidobacteriales bacterium]|nr:orotate phosphoribosyltransferase [Terriglobales bacterium]